MGKIIIAFVITIAISYPVIAHVDAACSIPPSDDKKLLMSVDFFLKRRPGIQRFRYAGDELHAVGNGNWRSPEDAVSDQPNCCTIIYEDRETFKASEVKDSMGENFGGFAHISFDYIVAGEDGGPLIVTAFESYALDYCGNPQIIISED